ncbi:UvrD-helicase domain-containing protein [Stieleria sp. TO1_6]|uniref:UvrD-helicase domain-containing protein n=1 Tax=Stieleria tagensis TaxID=2956795 RepID=UPI00209AF8D3|nr:UvrD-helicase domain-containing protein [Stieleria tagensis]MCO8123382.1 UvrD-helicase domain-containing protein [Stieleria tagensis]
MDSIEKARTIAAELHAVAVQKGLDPRKPYNFAKCEILSRDICLEATKPGATQLDGGRAKYIRNDLLIIHERCDTDFENAFLAAHELGHVVLGDDFNPSPSTNVDPARPAEPSPVAEDRVVDYGKRQRREIQMDLFAREFLLPRPVVKRMHLVDGMSASEIAKVFGAPFDVVAQQLFDAILLPVVETPSESPAVDRPLNDKQAAAASHRGVPLLVEAGPGTGKTQTLTSRVHSLLADGIDPREILLLTFSNKAAAEMADRIAEKNKEASAAMWIGTFHAFGLDLIRRFYSELGFEKDPRMIDKTEAVEMLEQQFPKFDLEHYRNVYAPASVIDDILKAVSRAKDEVVCPTRYRELAEAMQLRATASNDDELLIRARRCHEVARVYEAYEKIKKAKHCIDFGDLVSLPVSLLESEPTIANTISETYSHVLVDEYQDVNRSSVRLLKSICPDGANLWAVGDAKQSIYRFRGASSGNMKRFTNEDFRRAQTVRLEQNYRSVPEITDAFSAFGATMAAGTGGDALTAERSVCGSKVALTTVDKVTEQTLAIADSIEQMRQNGHGYRDQAILCTGNEKLATLAGELERLGIPVLFLGSLFERLEIKNLIAFLSLLTDRRAMGLIRVGCQRQTELTLGDVSKVIEHLRDDITEPGEWPAKVDSFHGVSESGKQVLREVATILLGFDQSSSPWTMLATILLDRTQIAADFANASSVSERTGGIAVWQFMNFLRVQPSGKGLPVPRLLKRIRDLIRLKEDRDLSKLPDAASGLDGVRLMTVHGSKGLEFPVVHFPGMNKTSLPLNYKSPKCPPPDGMVEGSGDDSKAAAVAAHSEEQECIFYVALSRARDRLIAYAPTKQAGGKNWPLSPFLDRLGSNLQRNHVAPNERDLGNGNEGTIPIQVSGRISLTTAQIGLFERCPRRFFYTHVVRIGGRREESPYTLMHDAVREICEAIVAERLITLSDSKIRQRLNQAFKASGLVDHGYANELAGMGHKLVKYFLTTRAEGSPIEPPSLAVNLAGDEVKFRPDDGFTMEDGAIVFRQVRTGGIKSSRDDIAAAAALLAATEHARGSRVEFVHLSDQEIRDVEMQKRKLGNRHASLHDALKSIRDGKFPAKPSSRTCPGCPAFFVCGSVPEGTLQKTF